MPAPNSRSGRSKPKRMAKIMPASLIVPEHSGRSATPAMSAEAPSKKETPQEESIRKMLEAAYT